MSTITLVTGNPHKLKEYELVLSDFEFRTEAVDIPEIQAATIREVAEAKARVAFEKIQAPVIVEDAGVCLEYWRGLPGPFTKYFVDAFPEGAGIRLLEAADTRKATAQACIAYRDAKHSFVVTGEIEGTISDRLHDGEGFGFDFYFIPDGHEQTFSEMGVEEKSKISHRRKAIEAFKEAYARLAE